MLRALVYIVPVALAVYALIELARSEPSDRAGLHPLAWAALIVLLPVVGPLTWIVVVRSQARVQEGGRAAPGGSVPRAGSPGARGGLPPRRPRPVAPDDDPEFLWRLDQQQRAASGQGGPEGRTDDPPVSPDADAPPAPEDGERGPVGPKDPS